MHFIKYIMHIVYNPERSFLLGEGEAGCIEALQLDQITCQLQTHTVHTNAHTDTHIIFAINMMKLGLAELSGPGFKNTARPWIGLVISSPAHTERTLRDTD